MGAIANLGADTMGSQRIKDSPAIVIPLFEDAVVINEHLEALKCHPLPTNACGDLSMNCLGKAGQVVSRGM